MFHNNCIYLALFLGVMREFIEHQKKVDVGYSSYIFTMDNYLFSLQALRDTTESVFYWGINDEKNGKDTFIKVAFIL